MTISPAPVPNNFICDDGVIMKNARFDIPAWNLQLDGYKDVDIGDITPSQVQMVHVKLWTDGQIGAYYQYIIEGPSGYDMMHVLTSDTIGNVVRLFATANWQQAAMASTAHVRGQIVVWYTV
jgi:hypothetical protein